MSLAEAISPTGNLVKTLCKNTQDTIVAKLNGFEKNTSFVFDEWSREKNKGGGISSIIENGSTFEKAGVNISSIRGQIKSDKEISMFSQLFKQQKLDSNQIYNSEYFATGVSLVIHPVNPFIPTVHMNYRFFEVCTPDKKRLWWFGGGSDLTPYFINEDDFKHFHQTLKNTCDNVDNSFYPLFKKKCDHYFYLPHRREHRGIGGIFFDYLNTESEEYYIEFITACANSFLPSYVPIIEKNHSTEFSNHDKQWQAYRRSRYVEFNLLHDRGTLFGLKTNGRIESIFMSLPRHASWLYDESIMTNKHKEFMHVITTPQNWIS